MSKVYVLAMTSENKPEFDVCITLEVAQNLAASIAEKDGITWTSEWTQIGPWDWERSFSDPARGRYCGEFVVRVYEVFEQADVDARTA